MRYFILKQNTNLLFGIKLQDQPLNRSGLLKEAESSEVFFLDKEGDETRPDLIEKPVMMVASFLKKILDLHQDGIQFENTVLIHHKNNRQYPYVKIKLPAVDAISELTEYYPNQMFKKLILSRRKIGDHQFFMVADQRLQHPVASLAVVESLLRRKAKGIIFEEVEVTDDRYQ